MHEREERRRIKGPVVESVVWHPMSELQPHLAASTDAGTVPVLVVFGGEVERGIAVLRTSWPDLTLTATVLLNDEALDAEFFTAWAVAPRGPVPDA